MQYFLVNRQFNDRLMPMKRTIVIPTEPGKKDITIRSDLKISPFLPSGIVEKFDFLSAHPDLIQKPQTTLIQLSHLRF